MLEVVTVWAPRPKHPKWRKIYGRLLQLQRESCARVGHVHRVVTDVELSGYDTLRTALPDSLMHAILAGQIAYLEQWSNDHPVVLADIDCVVCRDLNDAFDGTWDIGLTSRDNALAPIQNGAMYFAAGARLPALEFLRRALALCEPHWGGDQEAIAQAVAPIPPVHRIESRFGARLAFLSTDPYNLSPKSSTAKMTDRFIFHFKGDTKAFAEDWAAKHKLREKVAA